MILGEGAHLGLVKLATAYETIAPGTPYIRPAMPAPLDIAQGTIQHEDFCLKQDCYASINKHNEPIEVKKSLRKQLQITVKSQYLAKFKHQYTKTINQPISQVMSTLYWKHGKVKQTDVKS